MFKPFHESIFFRIDVGFDRPF